MLDSQCRKNNPREEMAWYTDNISVILQEIHVSSNNSLKVHTTGFLQRRVSGVEILSVDMLHVIGK